MWEARQCLEDDEVILKATEYDQATQRKTEEVANRKHTVIMLNLTRTHTKAAEAIPEQATPDANDVAKRPVTSRSRSSVVDVTLDASTRVSPTTGNMKSEARSVKKLDLTKLSGLDSTEKQERASAVDDTADVESVIAGLLMFRNRPLGA